MRRIFMSVLIGVIPHTAAVAAAGNDCDQNNDVDAKIRGCTLIIEGRAKGKRAAAYLNRGNAYLTKSDPDRLTKSDPDRAIQDFDEAIRIDPKLSNAYNNRSVADRMKSDSDRAIADASEAIRLDATNEKAYSNRGYSYIAKREYDLALADFNRSLSLVSKQDTAHLGRGNGYFAKGEFDKALADYNEVLLNDPTNAEALMSRGAALVKKGDFDRAIADLNKALGAYPAYADAYLWRGRAYLGKEDWDRSMADANEVVRLAPKSAAAYHFRAEAFSGRGDWQGALADYDRAIEIAPEDSTGHNSRAWLLFKLGKHEQAKIDADKAVALSPHAHALDTRAHILLALGKIEEALADFNAALKGNAGHINSLWGRGQIYEKQGRSFLAFADYKRALELTATGSDEVEAQNKARSRLIVIEGGTASAAQTAAAPALGSLDASSRAAPGRRVALVIGNGAYKAVTPLTNPANDAAAVAGELSRVGFEVIEKHDLGVADLRRTLGEFEDKAAGADWALVYYAGHGMELNGQNWLIPTDAKLARSSDMPDEAVALERVLDRLTGASRMRIVVLDACRNNPFASRMVMNRASTRAVARGLGAVEPQHGEVVFFAARDGNVALDGSGANSPFATALVKHMDEDGIELGRFFRKVTSSVLSATGNQQEPFMYGRLPDEDFYFKPPK